METKDLFQKVSEGYNCEQVEQYINSLKEQQKKVFEYAKATEANNEKLKKICRSLSDENKALKAGGSVAAAPATESAAAATAEKIAALCEAISKETAALCAELKK